MEVLKALVARIARAFYEPKYIVILDELNNAPPNANGVREEDLVASLKMAPKDIHRICGKLKEDRLLKMATRMEARKQDQRAVPKTYYYIDYKEFVDVVKWKMYKMQTAVRDNLRAESENKGYICKNCLKQYTPLDVLSLQGPDGMFHCDTCEHILDENDNEDNVQGSQEVLTRLREQSQPIISLLKQTDSLVIPASYIFKPMAAKNGANGGARDDHELAIAQDTGAGQGEIIVDLQMDNEAARRAKLVEAEEKRQQNMLPVWHQRSTVSDTIIDDKGDHSGEIAQEQDEEETFEDVGNEEFDADRHDYYAKYYESLSQAAPADTLASEEESDEEEYDVITNGNGKRSRSVDYDDEESNKRERVDAEDSEEEFVEDADIPLVSVNGKMVPLDQITQEDQRNMTTDEYKTYYEVWHEWDSR